MLNKMVSLARYSLGKKKQYRVGSLRSVKGQNDAYAAEVQEIERLRFTFRPNGRREFLPRDQVSPLFSFYSLLLPRKHK